MRQSKENQIKEQLLATKRQLLAQLADEDREMDKSLADSIGELSSYDNHPADIGTELFERSKDMALREHVELRIDQIDKAIAKIENGTYGKCEGCEKMIPEDRLESIPEAEHCVECHQAFEERETSRTRPVEEEVLYPGFGQHDYDDDPRETEFDAEDSWQAVAQYGTSDDPSMLGGETDYSDMYTESHEEEAHFHIESDQPYIWNGDQQDLDNLADLSESTITSVEEMEQQAYQEYIRQHFTE